jgi:hypothetical protein
VTRSRRQPSDSVYYIAGTSRENGALAISLLPLPCCARWRVLSLGFIERFGFCFGKSQCIISGAHSAAVTIDTSPLLHHPFSRNLVLRRYRSWREVEVDQLECDQENRADRIVGVDNSFVPWAVLVVDELHRIGRTEKISEAERRGKPRTVIDSRSQTQLGGSWQTQCRVCLERPWSRAWHRPRRSNRMPYRCVR